MTINRRVNCFLQFRSEKGGLPEAGDGGDAEVVYALTKKLNDEDEGFKAEGLDDSKVRIRQYIRTNCTRSALQQWRNAVDSTDSV